MITLYWRNHIGNTKKAVLVYSPVDVDTTKIDVLYISRNFLVQKYFENGSVEIEPYPTLNDKDNYDFITWLGLNWFRDEKGIDISLCNGFSIGNVIARRVLSAFANDYRNYFSINKLVDQGYLIYASSNESESFKRVALSFNNNIEWYTPKAPAVNFDITPDPERTVFFQFPHIHPLSSIARLVQIYFLKYARKRQFLNISDWSSINQYNKRSDTLIFNSLKPWTGYYFNLNKDILQEANNYFPDILGLNLLNPERIKHLIDINWNNKMDLGLAIHFCKLVESEYQKGKEEFKRSFAIYKEAFNHYKPKAVIIPGETQFGYVIAAQIANMMNIRTILSIDGYQIVKNNSLYYKNKSGNKFLFDKFIVYGRAHKDLMILSGIPEEHCTVYKSPLLSFQCNIDKENPKYNAIIMCYNPNQLNPNTKWDQRGIIILEIINYLLSNDSLRVAIKIKGGSDDYVFYDNLLTIYDLKWNVDILNERMSTHFSKTEIVIGQISTAVFESNFNNVPYYIYEPYENGKTDEMINSSKIFKRKSISRNIKELSMNIKNKTPSVTANRNYMFDGPEISQSDFNHFIN